MIRFRVGHVFCFMTMSRFDVACHNSSKQGVRKWKKTNTIYYVIFCL